MIKICVCAGSSCKSLGSDDIIRKFKEILISKNIEGINVEESIQKTGCHGFCEAGPIVVIYPEEILYTKVTEKDCEEIVESTINGTVIERLLFEGKKCVKDLDFYRFQTRYLLRRTGIIDPFDIKMFIEFDGFKGLESAVQKSSQEVIDIVKDSGLRGRGGAGFSTGTKWQFLKNECSDKEKVIVANADEGDPGSFMDRTLLEGDPFSVIEGMLIAAYSTGAKIGYIYCRAEYPEAVKILKNAIKQSYDNGYLGKNILNKEGFDFELKLFPGAGAFVCGEETALINSIEGLRGMPRQKPPFPANSGVFQKPTNINNVKTYSYVTHILREGIDSFKKYGSIKSPGTAVLSLTGKIKHTGIVEVPMGISIRDLVYKIGGGIKNDKKIKAVFTGGPSGGAIPKNLLDTKIDYESLNEIGSIMGSGGILVVDEDDSMPEIADFFMQFCISESCGKCVPCREGTFRIHQILDSIINLKEGRKEEDLDKIEEISKYIKDSALCGLGQTAPNPALTTIKYFREEYLEKINGVVSSYFITEKCVGCGICAKKCPVKTIEGDPKKLHIINQENCILCGVCYNACPVKAIIKKNREEL